MYGMENVFSAMDPLTCDGLRVDIDRDHDRIAFCVAVEGRTLSVLLVEPGAGLRLAAALQAALAPA